MTGIELIQAERERQVAVEGWTPGHDQEHELGELAAAAMCYASQNVDEDIMQVSDEHFALDWWPFEKEWWKPSSDPIRNLCKAGALIAAEIDRIQRADPAYRSGGVAELIPVLQSEATNEISAEPISEFEMNQANEKFVRSTLGEIRDRTLPDGPNAGKIEITACINGQWVPVGIGWDFSDVWHDARRFIALEGFEEWFATAYPDAVHVIAMENGKVLYSAALDKAQWQKDAAQAAWIARGGK